MKKKAAVERPKFECPECRKLGASTLAAQLCPGKQALEGRHRSLVEVAIDCSLNLETAMTGRPEGEKIFDYLTIPKGRCGAAFVEVHPASSDGMVDELLEKKIGTRRALARAKSPVTDGTWHWLVPGQGKVCFKASDAHGLRLALGGIQQPRRKLVA